MIITIPFILIIDYYIAMPTREKHFPDEFKNNKKRITKNKKRPKKHVKIINKNNNNKN